MRIGSLYSGIGGLDLACEWVFDADTVWQLDMVGEDVRRRHWPRARQVVGDITTIDPITLPRIDILCGGPSCRDLSAAGTGDGLEEDSAHSAPTYARMLDFADALRPAIVVIENVPALFSRYRQKVEDDYRALGYGLTWVKSRALDVGAPHRRARVFVVCRLDGSGGGVVDAPRDKAWRGDRWPTQTSSNPNEGEDPANWSARRSALIASGGRPISEPLAQAIRTWPTATATDANASGAERYTTDSGRHAGVTLTDATRPTATATATDHKGTSKEGQRRGQLGDQIPGHRLNPDWVETLMGFPVGWTRPDRGLALPGFGWAGTGRLCAEREPRWPRGRYPATWDRSKAWPGHDWEPPRTVSGEADDRPARLRAIGNAVCPQQGVSAISAAIGSKP